MAYVDEEEVWRCPIHPSKRRRHGVCPLCLRDKLINLCQNCANVRPCDCPEPAEPITELKRSRSVAAVSSFLRSKSTHRKQQQQQQQQRAASSLPPSANKPSSSFWSKLLKVKKKDRADRKADVTTDKKITMMMRSKSAGMGFFSNFGSFREGGGGSTTTTTSSKGWFASPVKALKQSKAAKMNNENSPLCRG